MGQSYVAGESATAQLPISPIMRSLLRSQSAHHIASDFDNKLEHALGYLVPAATSFTNTSQRWAFAKAAEDLADSERPQ